VCPDVVYRGNEEYQARRSLPAELVDWCITSGAMTLVAAWEATGGFDEALFIDGVDYDFCLRLRDAGLVVRRVNDVTILHELGALTCRRVLGRVLYITNHSGMRRYYQVRNRLYLQRKLRTSACRCFMSMIKEFVKVLVFERNRRVKMDYMLRGVRDGLRARRDGALGANSEGMR
jgi:rhamnosyltransferase